MFLLDSQEVPYESSQHFNDSYSHNQGLVSVQRVEYSRRDDENVVESEYHVQNDGQVVPPRSNRQLVSQEPVLCLFTLE